MGFPLPPPFLLHQAWGQLGLPLPQPVPQGWAAVVNTLPAPPPPPGLPRRPPHTGMVGTCRNPGLRSKNITGGPASCRESAPRTHAAPAARPCQRPPGQGSPWTWLGRRASWVGG